MSDSRKVKKKAQQILDNLKRYLIYLKMIYFNCYRQVFNRKAGQNWGQVCPHVRSQAVMVDVSRILFNWD